MNATMTPTTPVLIAPYAPAFENRTDAPNYTPPALREGNERIALAELISARRHCKLHNPPEALRPSVLDVLLTGRTLSAPLAVELCGSSYPLAVRTLESLAEQGVVCRIAPNEHAPLRYCLAPEYRVEARQAPTAVLAL